MALTYGTAAAETLDLGRPVAILLMATLSFVLDDAAAARILRSLTEAVPAGSHVSLYHQAGDLDPAMSVAAARCRPPRGWHPSRVTRFPRPAHD